MGVRFPATRSLTQLHCSRQVSLNNYGHGWTRLYITSQLDFYFFVLGIVMSILLSVDSSKVRILSGYQLSSGGGRFTVPNKRAQRLHLSLSCEWWDRGCIYTRSSVGLTFTLFLELYSLTVSTWNRESVLILWMLWRKICEYCIFWSTVYYQGTTHSQPAIVVASQGCKIITSII